MSLRTQYEFLFVGRDEGSFVENYAYDLGEGGELTGKIFINLEIQNNPVDAEKIGEKIFDTLRRTFFADPEQDAYVRFEGALKEVNRELKMMRSEKPTAYLGNLNVLIAAIVGKNLYVSQCGEAEAYLIRRRFCSVISEDLYDPNSKDVFTNIANGTLEVDDFVILSSTRLLRYIGKNDLAKVASAKNVVSSLAELRDFLSTEVLGKVGFIGIKALAEVPDFSAGERDQVVAHLRKEEEYDERGVSERKSVNLVFTDVVKKFKSGLAVLRTGVAGLSARNNARVVRGSSKKMLGFNFTDWTKEKIMTAFIVVVLILAIGLWWLRGRLDEQHKIEEFQASLNVIQEQIASAETNGQFDKEKAAQILNDAEQKAMVVLNSGYYRAKATELLQNIQNERDRVDGVVHVQPKILVDLSTKRANVSAIGLLSMGKGILYAYEYNALYPILLDKLQDPITLDETEKVVAGTIYEDKGSLLFYTNTGKLIEYKDNKVGFVQAADGSYKKGVAVQGYNNKFYVLDPENNQIWRYVRNRDKFDTAEQYNVDGDLKNGVSLSIDSNVYVLGSNGSITKLLRGSKQAVSIRKAPMKALTAPTKIFTTADMTQLYVLEPSTSRIVTFYKDDQTGGLVGGNQYLFDGIAVRDFYIDKATNKGYLMDQSRVYTFDL